MALLTLFVLFYEEYVNRAGENVSEAI